MAAIRTDQGMAAALDWLAREQQMESEKKT
jgi:hypothetical protein